MGENFRQMFDNDLYKEEINLSPPEPTDQSA